jgi:hypothetical protein
MRVSLRGLMALVTSFCLPVAFYYEFGLFSAAGSAVLCGVALWILGKRGDGRILTRSGTFLAVIGGLTVGLRFAWLVAWHPDFLEDYDATPVELERVAVAAGLDESEARFAYIRDFLDTESVWRIPASYDSIPVVAKELQMEEIDFRAVPAQFWAAFPWRWGPTPYPSATYFCTPGFSAKDRGGDGSYALAMFDRSSGFLYVWHKFNF